MTECWVFLEGSSDERFFSNVVKPKLKEKYDVVAHWPYRGEQKKEVVDNIRRLKATDCDILFLGDLDSESCILAKVEIIENIYASLEREQIVVVVAEIDSWYAAGLSKKGSKNLSLSQLESTNTLTKAQFKNWTSEIGGYNLALLRVLEYFSSKEARRRNDSFKRFYDKYCN